MVTEAIHLPRETILEAIPRQVDQVLPVIETILLVLAVILGIMSEGFSFESSYILSGILAMFCHPRSKKVLSYCLLRESCRSLSLWTNGGTCFYVTFLCDLLYRVVFKPGFPVMNNG